MEYSNQELDRIMMVTNVVIKMVKNFRPGTTHISGPLLGTILPTRVHVVVSEDFFFFCHGMQNLSSRTRDRTHELCSGSMESQLLDTREVPGDIFGCHNLGDAKGIQWVEREGYSDNAQDRSL